MPKPAALSHVSEDEPESEATLSPPPTKRAKAVIYSKKGKEKMPEPTTELESNEEYITPPSARFLHQGNNQEANTCRRGWWFRWWGQWYCYHYGGAQQQIEDYEANGTICQEKEWLTQYQCMRNLLPSGYCSVLSHGRDVSLSHSLSLWSSHFIYFCHIILSFGQKFMLSLYYLIYVPFWLFRHIIFSVFF